MPRIIHPLGEIPGDDQPHKPWAEPEIDPAMAWTLDPYAPVPDEYRLEVPAPTQDSTKENE